MKLSIIIPAYNAARHICDCLDSIYRLSLAPEDVEVFVVDDCSTDDTVSVLEQYRAAHAQCQNLHILKQPVNNRQGAARNRALAEASGEYVAFLDSDDQLLPGIVDALAMAERLDLEMVVMRSRSKNCDTGDSCDQELLTYSTDDVFSGVDFHTLHVYYHTVVWGFLYRRAFIQKVNYSFAEGVLYEDTDYAIYHLQSCKRMAYCHEPAYLWVKNLESTTHSTTFKHVADYFLLGCRMLNIHAQLADKSTPYADSILEGGSYNIWDACKRLKKLSGAKDVRLCFDRIDANARRADYLGYTLPRYCWTRWTRLCLRHRRLASFLVSLIIPLVKVARKVKVSSTNSPIKQN